MKIRSVIVLFLALGQVAIAQDLNYQQEYLNAKALFKEGKYNLAMEIFKKIVPENPNNPFSEYASFYYALSAYRQGYVPMARDMFNQVKTLHPQWEKMDEVNVWLGKIHFENKSWFQGLQALSEIKRSQLGKEVGEMKRFYLASIQEKETLRMIFDKYPQDKDIAFVYARALSKNTALGEDRKMLEQLIAQHNFKRSEFIAEAPPTLYKDEYAVAVLLPLMTGTLDPAPTRKRNQFVLDYYNGLRQALDTLSSQGIKISLRVYDTERNPNKIKRLLETEELKNVDLILGPFYTEENKVVQEFSMKNKINVVNPISTNREMIGDNPFGFMLQPTNETLGEKSAEIVMDQVKHRRYKNCMVFYGTAYKDSVMAAHFMNKSKELGLSIMGSYRLAKNETRKIIDILATPTEFDEWKNPIQFTLLRDTVSSVFVASDDPLFYSKVVSSVETRKDSTLVVGSENWLNDSSTDPEKYEQMGIILSASNFTSMANPHYWAFERKYLKVHGQGPEQFAKMGYETLLLMGNVLKKYGVYFQEGWSRDGKQMGYLTQGYDFTGSRANLLVPFVKFVNGTLTLIENR